MARPRHPSAPRVCAACGLHWLQRDGKPPRTYCSTTCRQGAEGRTAPPAPAALEAPILPTRIRRIRARLVTLTCAWCQAVAQVEQFPGPLPRYCTRDCREEAQRAAAAERMRRMRQRRLRALLAAAAPPPRV